MKHRNKIAIEILREEYADYDHNTWHYDREYKMIVKSIDKSVTESYNQALEDAAEFAEGWNNKAGISNKDSILNLKK